MASQVHPPRGMRDFLPVDKRRRDRVLAAIRDTYEAHGFEEIETPVMEDAARLHAGLGGDNEKLAFAVMKRRLTEADLQSAESPAALADLGLRFDLTVPLARYVATHRAELPPVFRSIQIAPVWRAERPQRGRFRQFMQCDIDIAGEPGIQAELEVLAATGDALQRLGLADAYIRVNDRRVLTAALDRAGVAAEHREAAIITIDKLDKIGADGVTAELQERGIDGGALLGLLDKLKTGASPEGFDDESHTVVRELMDAHTDIRLEFDPTLVRGMGYYTGAIFEIAHPDLPFSIGGGGRYDGMVGRFLGQDVPAVGLSLGFERLVDLVELADGDTRDVVALLVDAKVPAVETLAAKTALMQSGRAVRIQRLPKNPQNLIDQLAAAGATHLAFLRPGTDTAALDLKPIAQP